MLPVRQSYARFGKAKLRVVLAADDTVLSESTIGCILSSPRRRTLLIEPRAVEVRTRRPVRPWETRVPKDKRTLIPPGELVQLDTVPIRPSAEPERRQFPTVDVGSRYAVVGLRSQATAGTAPAFLDELIARMPFLVQVTQADGGSAFMAEFEQACQAYEIALYGLPPHSPKLNGGFRAATAPSDASSGSATTVTSTSPPSNRRSSRERLCTRIERPHHGLAHQSPAAVSHVSASTSS